MLIVLNIKRVNYIRIEMEGHRLTSKNMHNIVSRYNLLFSDPATLGQRHTFAHIGINRLTYTKRHSTKLCMNRISVGVIYIV